MSNSCHTPCLAGSALRQCYVEFVQAGLELFAGIIFVIGSVCLLPPYCRNVNLFVSGCVLFVVGALIYVGLSGFTLLESYRQRSVISGAKITEHTLFFVGSLIFVYGTFLFWPEKGRLYTYAEAFHKLSIVQAYGLMVPELEATVLFIIGSAIFAFAAFVGALSLGPEDTEENKMHLCISILNFVGSLLFVVGSIPYLPHLKCTDDEVAVGAWCYVVGSILFCSGGVTGLVKSWKRWHGELRSDKEMI